MRNNVGKDSLNTLTFVAILFFNGGIAPSATGEYVNGYSKKQVTCEEKDRSKESTRKEKGRSKATCHPR